MTSDRDMYTPGAGLPLGLPIGRSPRSAFAQVNGRMDELRETNSPRTSSADKPARISKEQLARIDAALSDRDREVLARIDEHRFLTTNQVQQFSFTGHASPESAGRVARSCVARLHGYHLITPLGRRVGGVRAGSSARIWQIAAAGARLLRPSGGRQRTHEPASRFLAHCLATGDAHLAVLALADSNLRRDVHVETEPTSWRRYSGPGGERCVLQPDLSAVISTPEWIDRFMIEVDLGTESLSTLHAKCRQYEAYRATGQEQERHHAFPRVIWFFTRPERVDQLRLLVAHSSRLSPGLFRYATPSTFQTVLLGEAS